LFDCLLACVGGWVRVRADDTSTAHTLISDYTRNANRTRSYYVAAINRVGTEVFPRAFTSGDGGAAHKVGGGRVRSEGAIWWPNGTQMLNWTPPLTPPPNTGLWPLLRVELRRRP
jgi:hypothetical protein